MSLGDAENDDRLGERCVYGTVEGESVTEVETDRDEFGFDDHCP